MSEPHGNPASRRLPCLRGYLIPWPHHWGYGVRKDGLHYRAWKWRGLLITPAKAVR